jgi:hypothetical protein
MAIRLLALGIASGAGCGAPTQAAQILNKPRVEVSFTLKERVYLASFDQTSDPITGLSELQRFQASVSAGMATLLSNAVGFIQFLTKTSPYRLHISLESEAASNPGFAIIPTFFNLTFAGLPENAPVPTLKWTFRDPQDYGRGVDPESFAEEILRSMKKRLDERVSELTDDFFSHVSLHNEICLIIDGNDVYCAIPFGYPDLQATVGTVFRFETRKSGPVPKRLYHFTRGIDVPLTSIPDLPYSNGLLTEEGQPPPAAGMEHTPLAIFQQSDQTVRVLPVQGLYVMRYIHRPRVEIMEHNPSSIDFP